MRDPYGAQPFHLFEVVAFGLDVAHRLAQGAVALVEESRGYPVVEVGTPSQDFGKLFAAELAQQNESIFLVLVGHQLLSQRALFLFFQFLVIGDLTVDKHVGSQYAQQNDGNGTAEVDNHRDDEADEEGSTGRDEPPADDRNDSGDAVDGTVATPGPVGE